MNNFPEQEVFGSHPNRRGGGGVFFLILHIFWLFEEQIFGSSNKEFIFFQNLYGVLESHLVYVVQNMYIFNTPLHPICICNK